MQSHKFDLLTRYPKNLLRIVAGMLMVGLSIYVTYSNVVLKQETNTMQLAMLPVFFLAGIYYFIIGMGINPVSFFGKAYIQISPKGIKVKPSLFAQEWQLISGNISAIRFKVASVQFNNNKETEFEYGKMSKADIDDVKNAIIIFAKENNITLS